MNARRLLLLAVIGASAALCVLQARASRTSAQASESPKVRAAVAPAYPPIAIAARAASDVVVEVSIDAGGNVSSATARSGHPLLQQAAIQAARRWRFEPAAKDSGARTATLTFTFRVNEEKRPEAEITPVFMPPYKVEIVGDPSRFVNTVNH
jgi:TonB family protein